MQKRLKNTGLGKQSAKLNQLSKLEDYSVGYKTSDIGLKDYYPNTDLIRFPYTLVE